MVGFVTSCFVFIVLVYKETEKDKKIKRYEFIVVLDEVFYEKQGELRTEATLYKRRWISYLQFSNNGEWEMEGTYYFWSDEYKMSSTGICNTSSPKDMFYVVLHKDMKKLLLATTQNFLTINHNVVIVIIETTERGIRLTNAPLY